MAQLHLPSSKTPSSQRADFGALHMCFDPARVTQAAPWLLDEAHYLRSGTARAQSSVRGAVWFIDDGANRWVLRRYRRGGMLGRFLADGYLWTGLHRTRAWREFNLLQELRAQGLPVPAPVAAGVWRDGMRYRAALLMEQVPQARSLRNLLLQQRQPEHFWEEIGALIGRLHALHVHHCDLNVDNLLLDGSGKLHLIDFDNALSNASNWRLQRGLLRFRRSLRKQLRLLDGFCYDDVADWKALLRPYYRARQEG